MLARVIVDVQTEFALQNHVLPTMDRCQRYPLLRTYYFHELRFDRKLDFPLSNRCCRDCVRLVLPLCERGAERPYIEECSSPPFPQ